ncbi:SUMO-specific isopeptidase USPL1-like [Triplophysa rosa]|uniref:SUMO-specific isopeptidase USPL1-like n=1 Tax=Triplophysa rosa TaxID=992332 RepID=UPI002545E2B0|nr:SUMO-specific isopeptidase USPL1-like [Triplophysa rosa]
MSSLWQQGSSGNSSISGRKMNSEDTGIGGPTPAVVWTFGKWEDKNASLGNCPWCLAKGQTNALRLSKTHEVDLDVNKKDDNVSSTQKTEDMFGLEMETPIELVPLRPHLFWKNEDNLCWLDSLLVMLVNCRTMREALNQDVNVPDSVARNIFSTYDKTCSYVKAKEQQCEDKVTRVPTDVLEEAERQLSDLRLSLIKLLQPTLKCEIGQEKMPVFALPLILRSDKWSEDLFQHTVRWEFKCTSCGHTFIKGYLLGPDVALRNKI